jgi:hypothetical protein
MHCSGSAKQKHPGVPRFQIYSSLSGPRLPHNALAIKIVPHVHNMILDNSAMQPGASYLALACTLHPQPETAGRLTIDVRIDARGMYYLGHRPLVAPSPPSHKTAYQQRPQHTFQSFLTSSSLGTKAKHIGPVGLRQIARLQVDRQKFRACQG